jgi:UDP-GlcNAc:undecaprenyl-phosphate/decaprenyl-phosphate GlcNAc-1-phosphate transferase
MDELDALLAFLVALAVSAALTPAVARLARRLGAVDLPRERGLSRSPTPLLGGLAIFAGVLAGALVVLPTGNSAVQAIIAGGALITLVGALDDAIDLPPWAKLVGQTAAAAIPVATGVKVTNITLPFLGAIDLGDMAAPLTLIGIVAVMNVVNFSDGVDGLAAGVCTITAAVFCVIAFDLGKETAAVLAAITAGAALGFLFFNFHPASIFMGDAGSNLLGFLLACIAVEGTLKTNAVIALLFPLVVLAVPFLDTGFVIAKRIKYGQPIYQADSWHFHHRFANIGFSQRRTVLYLYAWTLSMALLALALRFVPYSDDAGHFDVGWSIVLGLCFAGVVAASVYLVLVLEILKLRRLREWQLRRLDPDTTEHQIDVQVAHDLETGEFSAVRRPE